MKYETRKRSKVYPMAVALIALLTVAIGAIFLTKPHSVSAFALEEQLEETVIEFENALDSNYGANKWGRQTAQKLNFCALKYEFMNKIC